MNNSQRSHHSHHFSRVEEGRGFILFKLLFTTFLIPFTFDVFFIAKAALQGHFEVTESLIVAIGSMWSFGICIGQAIIGPFFDAWGRRNLFAFGMFLLFSTSIFALFEISFTVLLAIRFLQGFGVAFQLIGSRTMIQDLYKDKNELSQAYTWTITSTVLGAFIAPMIASYLIVHYGWASLFYLVGAMALVSFFFIISTPETKREGFFSISKKGIFKTFFADYFVLFGNPTYIIYTLVISLIYWWIFSGFGGISYVYLDIYNISIQQLGYLFSSVMLSVVLGTLVNIFLLSMFSVNFVLVLGLFGFFIFSSLGVLLAFLGLLTYKILIALILLANFSSGLVSGNVMSKAMIAVSDTEKGVAAALIGIIQFGFGGVALSLIGYLQSIYPSIYPFLIMYSFISFLVLVVSLLFIQLYE